MRKAVKSLLVLAVSAIALSDARAQGEPGFRVVVHAENPISSLPRGTVAEMFVDRVKRWDGGGRVEPVDQTDSRVRTDFTAAVLGRSVTSVRSYWQRQIFSGLGEPPVEVDGDRAVLDFVRTRRGAIGYVSPRARLDPGVRTVQITGELASDRGSIPGSSAGRAAGQPQEPAPVVVVDPRAPGILYVGSSNQGLLRSADGGETWSRVRQDLPNHEISDLAVDPIHPQIIYAGTRKGLYRSTDGGESFGFVDRIPLGVVRVAVDPHDPATLYVLAGHLLVPQDRSLWQSRDRGESFVALGPPRVSVLAFDAAGVGLYVVAGKAMWWSEDGQEWYRHGEIGYEVHDLVTDPSDPRRLYAATRSGVTRSLDSGATWQLVGRSQHVHRVLVAPPALLALGEQAIFRSLDGGDTWKSVAEVAARTIARDPHDPARLLIAGPDRFAVSSDHGASWQSRALPFPATPQVPLSRRAAKPPRPASPLPLILNLGPDDDHVAAIAVDPRNLETVYAASQHGVWKSLDAGDSWSFAGVGLELTDVHALAIDRENPGVLYAGTHGAGVWKSTDGGGDWRPARRGLADLTIHGLAIDSHNAQILYAGTRAGLSISRDGAGSWQMFEQPVPGAKADRQDGEPWMAPVRALAFEPRHGLEVTAGTEQGSFYEGNVTTLTAERLPGRIAVRKSRIQAGCRVLRRLGRHRPKPDECFDHYGIQPTGLPIRDLVFPEASSDAAYAATLFGLWRRPAGGRSWKRLRRGANVAAIAVDPRSGKNLFIGTTEGLRRSTDGGIQWRSTQVGEPVYSLAIDATGTSIYAGLGGGQLAILRDVGLRDGSLLGALVRLPRRFSIRPQGGTPDAAQQPRPAPPPATATKPIPGVPGAWRRLLATPVTRYRLRAQLATELLEREPKQPIAAPTAAPTRFDRVREILADCLSELRKLDGSIREVAFSPDGRWLATFHLMDDGSEVHSELRLHDLGVLRPSPTGLRPGLVHWHALHDLAREPAHLRPVWVLPDPGPMLAWSANGRYLATHAGLDRIQVWSTPARNPIELTAPRVPPARAFELELPVGLGVAALRDDGRAMAITGHGGFLSWVVHAHGPLSVTSLRGPAEAGATAELPDDQARRRRRLVLTRDQKWLLSFDPHGKARAWMVAPDDPAAEPEDAAAELFHDAGTPFDEVVASGDGRWLAGRTRDQVLLWRLTSEGPADVPEVLVEGDSGRGFGFLFSPDHRWLAVHGGGELRLWDVGGDRHPGGGPMERLRSVLRLAHDGELPTFSPDGRHFMIRDLETAQIWDLSHPTIPMHLEGIPRAAGWAMLSQPLEQWSKWSTKSSSANSRNRRWFALAEGIDVFLWDLAEPTPRAMIGRAGRFGPVGLHADEGPLSSDAN